MENLVVFSDKLLRLSHDNVKTTGSFTIQMDAIAVGLLIIATRNSTVSEIFEYGITGLLFPPYREELFAKNIATMLTDHDLKKKMWLTARQNALEFYDWNLIVEKYEGILAEQSTLHKRETM